MTEASSRIGLASSRDAGLISANAAPSPRLGEMACCCVSDASSQSEQQLAYWKQQLAGELPLLALPIDCPRPLVPAYRGGSYRITLPDRDAVERLARSQGTTADVVTLAVFRLLLHVYTGQDEVIVGTTIATSAAVNRIAVRCTVNDHAPVRKLMLAVEQALRGARHHVDYPF